MKFLLDTNVLSEPVKPDPDPKVLRWLERHSSEAVTAAPVWHELRFGCRRLPASARREKLERYLRTLEPALPVLAYDSAAADWHASERARLTLAGRTPTFVDGQIAAVAAVHGLTLVTRNLTDFRNFRGLKVRSIFSA